MIKMDNAERTVEILDNQTMKEVVFCKLIEFLDNHDCWHGEVYVQSDSCVIDSMSFMADLIDNVIKPKVIWKDN